ncbi:MAG: sigma-70 family RNA polymerase sigma factor [Planctomycetes bacterium]|nr:sigma-70 family RNA polymerase sigma factor [Planctomycetota bacterium]
MPPEDEKSFEELAVPHLETVYRVARRLARREHEAEDLVQETYLKAYKAFASFEMREYGIKPWLLKILHNTFLNRRARESRAPKATDQQTLEQMQEASSSDGDVNNPPELDYEHLDQEVKEAIDGLQPEFRSVLLLWATMELSYQEIADILSVPIGTVMSRLHRARRQLTRVLYEYARANRLVTEGPR